MKRSSAAARVWGAPLICIILALAALPAAKSRAQGSAGLLRLPGHIPAAAWTSRPVAEVAPAEPIDLALALPLRNQAELQQLLQRLYDPKDPLYGHFLSPEAFTERYAPTEAQYEAVAAYAQSQGLSVVATHPNRLLLDVSAPAATVERAFSTRLRWFQSAGGRTFRAPVFDPAVPAAIAGQLAGIVGLDNLAVRRPHVRFRGAAAAAKVAPRVTGSGPGGGLSPSDIKTAYDLASASEDGTGQSLAVFELDGYRATDVTAYEDYFGLPHVPLQNVLVDGVNGSAGSGAIEVTLDIELEAALDPAAARIMVYEGPNSDTGVLDTYNRIATDNLAQAISTSWGLPELETTSSVRNSESNIFAQLAAQGQTFCAAAGDSGAYDDGSTLSVDDPASQPNVTGVGGTSLTTNGPGGARARETTWNGGSIRAGGGGGGVSSVWSQPSFQSGVVSQSSGGSSTQRNVPDVSFDADPQNGYAVYEGGQWQVIGGTSCAAPLWAAFAGLVNQARAGAGLGPVGFLNAVLYPAGEGARGTVDFYDVADGSTNLHYAAVAGYDEATGWGPFDGANLLRELSGGANSTQQGPSLSNPQVSPRNLPSSGGQVSVSAQVTSNVALTGVTVAVTPPGGSATTAALTRSGNTNTYSATLNIPANQGAAAAVYQLTFNATDANGNSGSLDGGSVNVAAPDLTPPTITNPTVAPTSLGSQGGTVNISASVTDNVLVSSVTATITEPDASTVQLNLTSSGGVVYSGSYVAPANGTTAAQVYQVRIQAVDNSGNSASASAARFTVAAPAADSTPPVISGAGAAPTSLPAGGGIVAITATVTDNVAVASVVATLTKPGGSTAQLTLNPGAGSKYTANYPAPANGANTAQVYSVSVQASDTSGNTSSASAGNFTVAAAPDNTPPVISGAGVAPAALPAAGGNVTISATVTDNVAVASVSAVITKPDGGSAQVTLNAAGGSSYRGTYTAAANVTSASQMYGLTIHAADTSGNAVSSSAGSFTVAAGIVDHTPPVVHSGSLSPRSLKRAGGTITIKATATDNIAVASVIATITEPNRSTVTVALAPAGGSAFNGSYTAPSNFTGKKQTYKVTVRATDTAGNQSRVYSLGTFTVSR